jgi:hypothetical protein
VFAKQIEISVQLAVNHEQLKAISDHEQRIRALERWRYSMPVAAVGSVGLSVWSVLHR